MSAKEPILITLYWWGSGEGVRVAEFRLNRDGRVTLTRLDPTKGRIAQEYYDHGVDFVAEGRTVWPADGPAFMRALLQPFRTTYYHFVDESAQAETS